MDTQSLPYLAMLAGAGLVGGLFLLARGMGSYREATRIADTATSHISSLAAGEVRVSGLIEPAELTLISPLQSKTCVYYRSTVDDAGDGPDIDAAFQEERAVGFRVRDPSGDIRVFPRGARWDARTDLDVQTGMLGDEPPGLMLRTGQAVAGTGLGREAAMAVLLTVQPAASGTLTVLGGGAGGAFGISSGRRRRYRESLLSPGDEVTIIGRAIPFSDLADPAEADIGLGSALAEDDPEVMGDIAEARAVGLLEDPDEAWGNAAIPGFGIGRPTRTPELDPDAAPLPIASPTEAAEASRRFTIAPEALVLASAPGAPLLIAYGVPSAATERQQDRFLVGLLGAIVAIGSAVVLAVVTSNLLGR